MAAVTPSLNGAVGKGNWQVDINDPDKVLTVAVQAATEEAVINAVAKAGFKAEPLTT